MTKVCYREIEGAVRAVADEVNDGAWEESRSATSASSLPSWPTRGAGVPDSSAGSSTTS